MFFPFSKTLFSLSFALFIAASCFAFDSITIDFPIRDPLSLPAKLSGQPQVVAAPDGAGYIRFPLVPSSVGESGFVTIVFRENGANSLGAFWVDSQSSTQTTLAGNLAEGITGLNQRTLQIPAARMEGGGTLVLAGAPGDIERVRFDRVAASPVYVVTDQAPVSLIVADRLQSDPDLSGAIASGLPDTWLGRVLDAPLQEVPASLDKGAVEFSVPIGSEVSQVLLRAKFLGLPLNESVTVWLNGQVAGKLQPMAPPLTDVGYVTDAQGLVTYAGWRTGSIFLPASLLKQGDNSIQVESKTSGVYIRDAALQLKAPAENPATVVTGSSTIQDAAITNK